MVLYIFILVAGITLSACVYSIYSLCTNMVAGEAVKLFNLGCFVRGVYYFTPAVILFSGVIMCFYMIRHPVRSALPMITYAVLYLAAWAVLMPLNFKLLGNLPESAVAAEASSGLSDGYFRSGENGSVYYYSNVSKTNVADGLCIAPGLDHSVYTFSDMQLPEKTGFSDPLIQTTVDMPYVMGVVIRWFATLLTIAQRAFSEGFFSWLCFSSLALALISVAGLHHASKWRLVNALSVVLATLAILVVNILGYTKSFLDGARNWVNGFFSSVPQIKNPMVVLFNVVLGLLFLVFGLVLHLRHQKERRESEEYY